MKLKKEFTNKKLNYKLSTHDGQYVVSEMPASVAEEILQRADSVELIDDTGFELCANGEMFFPKDAFEYENSEIKKQSTQKRSLRRSTSKSS